MHKHTINIRQIQTYASLKIGHNSYGRLDFSHKYKTLHAHTADMNLFALKHGSYTDIKDNPCISTCVHKQRCHYIIHFRTNKLNMHRHNYERNAYLHRSSLFHTNSCSPENHNRSNETYETTRRKITI